MKKELSVETCKILFEKNRVKAADLLDGQTFLTLLDGDLHMAEAVHCDECSVVGTINGGNIDARTTPESALLDLKFSYGLLIKPDDVSCYDADGSGSVLCSECAANRDAALRKSEDKE